MVWYSSRQQTILLSGKNHATMTVGPTTKIVRDYIGMIMITIKEDV